MRIATHLFCCGGMVGRDVNKNGNRAVPVVPHCRGARFPHRGLHHGYTLTVQGRPEMPTDRPASAQSDRQTDFSRGNESSKDEDEDFVLLVDSAHDFGMILTDREGRVVRWNTG